MHCHLHRGDWSFHLTNEKKKKQKLGKLVTIVSHLKDLTYIHVNLFCNGQKVLLKII